MATAKALGLEAIAVTDRNTLAGVVRAHLAAKEVGIKFIVGARLDLQDAPSLLAFPRDRAAYGRLCRLLTLGQRRAEKGECTLYLDDVAAHAEGLIFIALPPRIFPRDDAPPPVKALDDESDPRLRAHRRAVSIEATAGSRRTHARSISRRAMPIAATTAPASPRSPRSPRAPASPSSPPMRVLYHAPHRRPLQDVLTCIREKCTIHEAGLKLEANAERHLKPADEMARLFHGHEEALGRTSRSPTPAPSPSTS